MRRMVACLTVTRAVAAQVCKHYMEKATCKFRKNCRFNHPNIAFRWGPLAGNMVTYENQPN